MFQTVPTIGTPDVSDAYFIYILVVFLVSQYIRFLYIEEYPDISPNRPRSWRVGFHPDRNIRTADISACASGGSLASMTFAPVLRASRLPTIVQLISICQIHVVMTYDIIVKKVSRTLLEYFQRGMRTAFLPPYIYYIFRCHNMSLRQKPRQQRRSCMTSLVSLCASSTICHSSFYPVLSLVSIEPFKASCSGLCALIGARTAH